MIRLLVFIGGNILAIFLASRYIDGVTVASGWQGIIIVGLIFSVLNFLLKPILKLLLGPFILLTLGLLLIVINIGIIWATDVFSKQLTIQGITPLLLVTVLIGAINFITHLLFRK